MREEGRKEREKERKIRWSENLHPHPDSAFQRVICTYGKV